MEKDAFVVPASSFFQTSRREMVQVFFGPNPKSFTSKVNAPVAVLAFVLMANTAAHAFGNGLVHTSTSVGGGGVEVTFTREPGWLFHAWLTAMASLFEMIGHTWSSSVLFSTSSPRIRGDDTIAQAPKWLRSSALDASRPTSIMSINRKEYRCRCHPV